MADVIKSEEGQLMLLTVFLIIIGVVSFTYILNSMIFSSNLQSAGLEESKQEIRDFRLITEAEVIKAAYYANTTVADTANQTQVKEYFYNHMNSFNETIKKIYSAKGASVEIVINNVSLNRTPANMTVKKYYIESKNHTFKIGSLIIPMDDNQTQPQSNTVKVYGLIYKIVDDKGTQPLNQTQIPVWTILQNPVNDSVPNFSSLILTDDNATAGNGNITYRNYSGGPFIIDIDDLNVTKIDWILAEAKKNNITLHELKEDFYYEKCIQMVVPPKVAIYPSDDASNIAVMETYYKHGDIPYTALNDSQIQKVLNDYDILTIPHHDMRPESNATISSIVFWVAAGGILNVHCYGTWTMDKAVETSSAGSVKPWYGFIGVNDTDEDEIVTINMTFGKFTDNSSFYNATYRFNSTPLVPLSGLANPGAPFSPLAQSSNKSGLLSTENGLTELISLRNNASQVNPDTNILAYAVNNTRSAIYEDLDSPLDKKKEAQLIYIEATYENGLVSYIAGHNQSERVGGERLVFENFFAASMRTQLYSAITAKTINMTIKYFDGKVKYTDTFIINI